SSKSFAFKIANPEEQEATLEFQNAMMLHLLSKNLGLEIPEVIFSVHGNLIEKAQDSAGNTRLIRMLTWVDGRPLATVKPHSSPLLFDLGVMCGKISKALADFDHPAAHRHLKWDLAQVEWVKPHIQKETDREKAKLLTHFFELYNKGVKPIQDGLPKTIIYNDANDYNVLVRYNNGAPKVPGVIDFGDAVYSQTVNDLAIALAYAMMHKPDPLQAARQIVRGYSSVASLNEDEIKVLFPLITARLLISVTCSGINKKDAPENEYLQISDEGAWELLRKLYDVSPAFAHYAFRDACGMSASPTHNTFIKWAKNNVKSFKPIVNFDLKSSKVHWLDLGIGSVEFGNQSNVLDDHKLHDSIVKSIAGNNAEVGIGKYNEARPFYTSRAFESEGNNGPEWRTIHLGLDVFFSVGEPVFAPCLGVVHSIADNEGQRNYGPTVILKHEVLPELTFYTLYGHLNKATLNHWKPGDKILAGDQIGAIGGMEENGGWSPHLHFQIMLDNLGKSGDFPGVALPSQRSIWTSICPDPWWLINGTNSHGKIADNGELISYRKSHLGKYLSLSYQQPLRIERGYQQYLFDSNGRKYLDTVNNVAHVGHEHPRVVAAGQNQMGVLNTNTRYLHKNIIEFTETLLATMPKDLDV
ncbi:MAG: phosphotransferase, partial [Cyclobacteriaceae bacterium]